MWIRSYYFERFFMICYWSLFCRKCLFITGTGTRYSLTENFTGHTVPVVILTDESAHLGLSQHPEDERRPAGSGETVGQPTEAVLLHSVVVQPECRWQAGRVGTAQQLMQRIVCETFLPVSIIKTRGRLFRPIWANMSWLKHNLLFAANYLKVSRVKCTVPIPLPVRIKR